MLANDTKYEVINVGGIGLTVTNRTQKTANRKFPGYAQTIGFKESLTVEADFIYLLLGMNDGKYKYNKIEFENNFNYLIKSYIDLKPKPKIFIMTPFPIYNDDNSYC